VPAAVNDAARCTVDCVTETVDGQTIASDSADSAVLVENGGSLVISDSFISSSGGATGLLATGDGSTIDAEDVTLSADGAMAAIEGEGFVALSDSDLTGAGANGAILFRGEPDSAGGEADGDASEANDATGEASFSAVNCKLTGAAGGPFFSVTGTQVKATLAGSTLTYASGVLARVSGSGGIEPRQSSGADPGESSGANPGESGGTKPGQNGGAEPGKGGAEFTLSAVGQVLSGDIMMDGASSFRLSLEDGSIYTGAVDSRNAGRSAEVALDNNSSWTLTADSHVDQLVDAKADLSNIQSNGFTLYYDASDAANAWLGGRTIALQGGGSLTPEPAM